MPDSARAGYEPSYENPLLNSTRPIIEDIIYSDEPEIEYDMGEHAMLKRYAPSLNRTKKNVHLDSLIICFLNIFRNILPIPLKTRDITLPRNKAVTFFIKLFCGTFYGKIFLTKMF